MLCAVLSHACINAMTVTICLACASSVAALQSIFCFENVMELGRQQGLVNEEQPVLCKPNKQVRNKCSMSVVPLFLVRKLCFVVQPTLRCRQEFW